MGVSVIIYVVPLVGGQIGGQVAWLRRMGSDVELGGDVRLLLLQPLPLDSAGGGGGGGAWRRRRPLRLLAVGR